MSSETSPVHDAPRKRDPLSAFLMGAAVLLAVMYGLETWSASTLEKQELAAAQLSATTHDERLGDCALGAAGQGGEHLVMRCSVTTAAEAHAILAQTLSNQDLSPFETIHIHGPQDSLRCAIDGDTIAACHEGAQLSSES
ncbi:MAG: hypothetical protein ACNA8W_01510 [Bradymonadaceae bacterium]